MLDRRSHQQSWIVRFADGLDAMMTNFMGSADVGPYVAPDPSQPRADMVCPSCGQLISTHQTDRTAAIGRLYCPSA